MRKFFIYTFFFVIVAALVIQCVALQYRDGEIYSEKSFKKQIRDIPIRVTRATIYDRNFNPIAVTIPMDSLFINRPRNFLKNEKINFSSIETFATARRITVIIKGLRNEEIKLTKEIRGPSTSAEKKALIKSYQERMELKKLCSIEKRNRLKK